MDLDGVEQLDLQALGGADQVTIGDMSGTDFRQANVDLGAADFANDSVSVQGTDHVDNVSVTTDGSSVRSVPPASGPPPTSPEVRRPTSLPSTPMATFLRLRSVMASKPSSASSSAEQRHPYHPELHATVQFR